MRTRAVGRYNPAPPQGNDGHGPVSAAGAGLGLVSDFHSVLNLIKLLIFPVSVERERYYCWSSKSEKAQNQQSEVLSFPFRNES